MPHRQRMPFSSTARQSCSVLSSLHGILIMSIPEINPTGSPSGEVSISCWTTSRATTISQTLSVGSSPPATPLFIISSGEYFRIIVWVQTAAFTLPTPLTATTASRPHKEPTWNSHPAAFSILTSDIMAVILSVSTLIAPIIPIMAQPPLYLYFMA